LIILGIESALPQGMVFLGEDEKILSSRSFSSFSSSVQLIPGIESVLNETGISRDRLDLVVVSTGPGSFTGIRIGLSLAKTLAFCLNLAVVGAPTLDCIAFSVPFSGYICPLIKAYRNSFFSAFFKKEKEKIQKISNYLFLSFEEISKSASHFLPDKKVTFILPPGERGNLIKEDEDFFLIEDKVSIQKAFLKWGLMRFFSKMVDDPLTLSPIYVSEPLIDRRVKRWKI